MSSTPAVLLRKQPAPWSESGPSSLFDYCLLPYLTEVSDDALSSRNLLDTALALMDRRAQGNALIDRLLGVFGPHRTVWGVTRARETGELSIELYLYRRPHSAVDLSVARFAELLKPTTTLLSRAPADVSWHMFSVQLDASQLAGDKPAVATLYSDVVSMSYTLGDDGPELANHYDFHDPVIAIDAILEQLQASVHAPKTAAALLDRLPPQLQRCYHVCVAQKREADAVYHSRITTDQLQFFLAKHSWPPPFVDLLSGHKSQLSHVLWDVGASYQRCRELPESGPLRWPKSGFYASL